MNTPTHQEFLAIAKKFENCEIRKWRELPKGIYFIKDIQKYSSGYKLTLYSMEDCKEYLVWTPSRMNEDLDINTGYKFVKNHGLRTSSKTDRQYFYYQLL